MSKLDDLRTKYPLIFKDLEYFECCDGWYWLIDKICQHLMWDPKTGGLRDEPAVVVQVKEKFGTLRFYANGGTPEDYTVIGFAEFLSGSICEGCGTTEGVLTHISGWVRTSCQPCEDERLKRNPVEKLDKVIARSLRDDATRTTPDAERKEDDNG